MGRKGKGFTLIELIIVVAIIGIMAAIAIPKFARLIQLADCKKGDQKACAWLRENKIPQWNAAPAPVGGSCETVRVINT